MQVRTRPWWEPQYFIPMLGMVLGNCISSISVGLSALLEDFTTGEASMLLRPTVNEVGSTAEHRKAHGLACKIWRVLHQFCWQRMAVPICCDRRRGQGTAAAIAGGSTVGGVLLNHQKTATCATGACSSFSSWPAGKDKIELLLSLGATRWEASKATVARCVRLALTPILNQMNVVVSASVQQCL